MPQQDTSQQGLDLTLGETDLAATLFPDADDGLTPTSDVARTDGTPDTGTLTGKAPTEADGEMGEGKATDGTDGNDAGVKSTDTDDKSEDEVDPDIESQAEALREELLGSENTEPASDPAWKSRYGDLNRAFNESHRVQMEREANLNASLAEVGLQTVQTATGLKIARMDGYKDPRVDEISANDAWANLTDAEKVLFDNANENGDGRKAFELAFQTGVKQLAARVPPTTAKTQDMVLPQSECDRIYTEFTTKRLSNGSKMWPDCEKPAVALGIQQAVNAQDPVMTAMREAAMKDPKLLEATYQLGYLRHFRAEQVTRALVAEAKRQKLQQVEKNKQTTTVPGAGGSSVANNQGAKSKETELLDLVAPLTGRDKDPNGIPYFK